MKNYKVCTFPEVYKEITLNFKDCTEYPSNEQLFNGLPMNEAFIYVSSTYLNGLINYTKIKKAFLNFKYKYVDKTSAEIIRQTIDQIEEMTAKEWFHSKLSKFENDVYVIAEIEDSWIILEYDMDVSDCCISRVSKQDYTYEQIEEYVISMMQYNSQIFYNAGVDQYIELPHPEGWIKF